MGISQAPTPSFRSLMIFIDGGYLRRNVIEMVGNDDINYQNFVNYLADIPGRERIKADLIRVYYYDAIVDDSHKNHPQQKLYFNKLQKLDLFEVRLGRIKTSNKPSQKQKGVDVLLAIDMLSKAYLNHYDWGLLLAGDDDFLDLVKTIKNTTGKQIIGAYFERHISDDLISSFDKKIPLKKEILLEMQCISEK